MAARECGRLGSERRRLIAVTLRVEHADRHADTAIDTDRGVETWLRRLN